MDLIQKASEAATNTGGFMTETMWTTLIAVGATLAGVAITGWITSRQSKAQREHDRGIHQESLAHQTLEANTTLARAAYSRYLSALGELTWFAEMSYIDDVTQEHLKEANRPTFTFSEVVKASLGEPSPVPKHVWQEGFQAKYEAWIQARGALVLIASHEVRELEARVAGAVRNSAREAVLKKQRGTRVISLDQKLWSEMRMSMQKHVGIDIEEEQLAEAMKVDMFSLLDEDPQDDTDGDEANED